MHITFFHMDVGADNIFPYVNIFKGSLVRKLPNHGRMPKGSQPHSKNRATARKRLNWSKHAWARNPVIFRKCGSRGRSR
jgi:hypothetical protein